jgi:hypothetical protein
MECFTLYEVGSHVKVLFRRGVGFVRICICTLPIDGSGETIFKADDLELDRMVTPTIAGSIRTQLCAQWAIYHPPEGGTIIAQQQSGAVIVFRDLIEIEPVQITPVEVMDWLDKRKIPTHDQVEIYHQITA